MTERRILVSDLDSEQREKLSDLALITGRDEQELLDNMPQIIDGIIKAFEPVKQSIIQMGDSLLEAWQAMPPEFHEQVAIIVAEHEANQRGKG